MIKYFVTRYIDGSIEALIRITDLSDIIFGEYWREGSWIRDDNVLQLLLGDTQSEEVSNNDANRITAQYLIKKEVQ